MSPPHAAPTPETLERALALFDACADLPAHEREALLAAQAGQPELARLLRAMLAADVQVGDLFETPGPHSSTKRPIRAMR